MQPHCIEQAIGRVLYKLRMHREVKGISQLDLATKLGVSLRSYQRIEAGESSCDLEFLIRYCLHLNLKLEEIVTIQPPEKIVNSKLFCKDDNTDHFFNQPHVLKTEYKKLINFINESKLNFDAVSKSDAFLNFPEKLIIFNTQKKILNNYSVSELKTFKPQSKTHIELLDINVLFQFFDCVHYYRPYFSMGDPSQLIRTNDRKHFKTYNSHYYFKQNEFYSISLLETV